MSLMVNLSINVHISPNIIFLFPSTTSSAPIFVIWIPRPLIKLSATLTFSKRWTRNFGLEAYRPRDSLPRTSRRWMSMTLSERVQPLIPYSNQRVGSSYPIGKVGDQVINRHVPAANFRIQPAKIHQLDCVYSISRWLPFSKGLLLNRHPLLFQQSHLAAEA